MKDKILVIGGYGQVGQVICTNLSNIFPTKVIAAGRNFQKAKDFSLLTSGKVIPEQIDIYSIDKNSKLLKDICVVIMCLDQKNVRFVNICIENKIHYIDISPSYTILSQIESLNHKAKEFETTLVLGVGLAPGLSNLLVKYSKAYLDTINLVDIFLLLGIGEKHGRDGVEWLLNNINSDFTVVENNCKKTVKSFEDRKKTKLLPQLKLKTTYRFNLADQHIIPKTLGIKTVSSRLCYDSRFVTKEVALLKKLGVFNLVKIKLFKNLFIKLFERILNIFKKFNIGSDLYVVKVEVEGIKEDREMIFEASISGYNNSKLTGGVASIIAEKLFINEYPSGVHYVEQLFELEEFIEKLKKNLKLNFYTNKSV